MGRFVSIRELTDSTCLCEETDTISLEDRISIAEYNTDICLLDVIKECASVEIPLGDSKPQGICKTCVQDAKISFTFRRKCERSQILLAQELVKVEDLFTSDDDIPLSEIKTSDSEIIVPNYAKSYKTRKTTSQIHLRTKKAVFNKNDIELQHESEFTDILSDLKEEYVCQVCSKSFSVRKYYFAHIERHAEGFNKIVLGDANCDDLDKNEIEDATTVKTEIDPTRISTGTFKRKRLCKECTAVLGSHREWKEHMKTHRFKNRRGKSRCCPECMCNFDSHGLWLNHVRTAHVTFTCRECNITSLRNIRQLKAHMVHFHSDNFLAKQLLRGSVDSGDRTCDICGKTYITRESMFKHKRLKHITREQEDQQGVSYCDYCHWKGTAAELAKHKIAEHAHMKTIECIVCNKTFFTNHSLRLHMLVHTGERKHMCEVCGSSFALQSNLIIHKRVHTGEKPYKCDQCDKAFTQHSSLHAHKFTHTDKPTFSCDQCGATFFRKDSFRSHMKKHRSEDEWDKCEICDKRFKSRKLLKDHMVVHTGERNHQCTVCEKSFGRRSSLRIHLSIHTGEKPHVCAVCGRGFLQKHVLITHMKTHGNKLINK